MILACIAKFTAQSDELSAAPDKITANFGKGFYLDRVSVFKNESDFQLNPVFHNLAFVV